MFKQKSIEWMAAKLMGRNHWCRDWLAALLMADAALLDHILEQGRSYPHYLCLVNIGIQDNPDAPRTDAAPAELAALIRSTPKKRLLKRLFDPCPDGLSGMLKRLAPRPLSRAGYKRLLRLLGKCRARTYLLHNNATSHAQLRFLEWLPHELRDCPAIRGIKRRRDIDYFKYYIDIVHRLSPIVGYAEIALSLRHLTYPATGKRDYPFLKKQWSWEAWLDKQLLRKDFPEPPWPGNDWIQPITNHAQLRQTARLMRNCIADGHYLMDTVMGGGCYYVTQYKPHIVILARQYDDKWHLHQAEGTASEKLDADSQKNLLLMLQKAGWTDLQAQRRGKFEMVLDPDTPQMSLLDFMEA